MTQVNRYLTDKAMDHIDHALGRPVDPMSESFRNYFYVIGDTELRRHMEQSEHWTCIRKVDDGAYFAVSDAGRSALAAHLKQIGDKHRLWTVSYRGYDTNVVATTAAKARYYHWLDVSDAGDIPFGEFARASKVKAA